MPLAVFPKSFEPLRIPWKKLPIVAAHRHCVDHKLTAVITQNRRYLKQLAIASRAQVEHRVVILSIDSHRVARRVEDVVVGDLVPLRRRINLHLAIVLRNLEIGENRACGPLAVRSGRFCGPSAVPIPATPEYPRIPPRHRERFQGFSPLFAGSSRNLTAIGAPRFELGTSPTRTVRATRLRHAPMRRQYHIPPASRYVALNAAPLLRDPG